MGEEQVMGGYQKVIFGHVKLKMYICYPSGHIWWVAVKNVIHKRNLNQLLIFIC